MCQMRLFQSETNSDEKLTVNSMPENEVFATQEEIIEFVRWLLDRGCEFIPDLHYDTPRFDRHTHLSTIESLSESVAQFYVIRSDFIQSPLEVREVTTTDKHFFYVSPRAGGPKLLFHWGRNFEQNGRKHLSATDVGYYPWYENTISGEKQKPPRALRTLYSEFTRMVRQTRRRIKPGKREFWISPKVEELIREGLVLVGLEAMPVERILAQ